MPVDPKEGAADNPPEGGAANSPPRSPRSPTPPNVPLAEVQAGKGRDGEEVEEEELNPSQASQGGSQGGAKAKKTPKTSYRLLNPDNEDGLVDWIFENPILWNPKDRNYMKKEKKISMWNEKAVELNETSGSYSLHFYI